MKLLLTLIFSKLALSADLVTSVNSLSKNIIQLGQAIGVIGILVASIYLTFGKHEGKEKLGLGIVGIVVIILAPSIVEFIKGVL